MSKHIFIGGLPSSGTTAVKNALAGLHFASVVGPFQDGKDCKFYPRAMVEVKDETYTKEQEHAVKQWLARYDKGGWVIEKTPAHYRCFTALQKIFPAAYFLCLKRNPYDVMCSQRRRWKGYGADDKKQFQYFKEDNQKIITKLGLMLDFMDNMAPKLQRFRWVSYEELCDHPQQVLRELTKFLGVVVPDNRYVRAAKKVNRNPRTYNPDVTNAPTIHKLARKLGKRWGY